MNIGGYDDSAFFESDGNRLLGGILEHQRLIKVHFTEGDKTPNIDGFFEVCKNAPTKKIPVGRFNVQIKTMNADYCNNNKSENISDYKYTCDTKIFNYVKSGCSNDPAILFLVDINNKKVFYIHVSPEYVLGLNLNDEATKVIFFNESDNLEEETFYSQFVEILRDYNRRSFRVKENIMTISSELDSKTIEELQDIIDDFNNVFSNELSFIKQHLYPKIWKFGIAYVKHDEVSATIGIYKVQKGTNGRLIKKFIKDEIEDFESISYYMGNKKSTKEIISDVMFRIIDNYFDKSYIDPTYLSQEILEEISFYFLDTIAKHCDVFSRSNRYAAYYKDVVSAEEVRHMWDALIEYSLESSYYLRLNPTIKAIKMDPFDSLSSGPDVERRQKLFESITQNPTGRKPKGFDLILEGNFSYRLVQRVIQEITKRNISSLSRIWEPPDYDRYFEELKQAHVSGFSRHETGYLLADFSKNLQMLLTLLPNVYSQVNNDLLGKYSSVLKITSEYHIYVEPTHEAKCIQIELPSTEFKISQPDELINIDMTDLLRSEKELYPKSKCLTITGLHDAFSKSYPLYRNVSYLVKKSVYNYFNRDLHFSFDFTPIFQ